MAARKKRKEPRLQTLSASQRAGGKGDGGVTEAGVCGPFSRHERRRGSCQPEEEEEEAVKEKPRGGGTAVYFVQTEADVLLEERRGDGAALCVRVRGGDRRSCVGFTARRRRFTSDTHGS